MKKAVSPIVASVLLILITITAAIIIGAFVKNMIQNLANKSKECGELLGKIHIDREATCYNKTTQEVYVGVALETGSPEIKGLFIALEGGGVRKAFKLIEGNNYTNVKEIDKNYNEAITIVKPGEIVAYVFNITDIDTRLKESVTITPITEGGYKCGEIKETITEC